MTGQKHGHNRLTPWYAGLIVILAAVIFVGLLAATARGAAWGDGRGGGEGR